MGMSNETQALLEQVRDSATSAKTVAKDALDKCAESGKALDDIKKHGEQVDAAIQQIEKDVAKTLQSVDERIARWKRKDNWAGDSEKHGVFVSSNHARAFGLALLGWVRPHDDEIRRKAVEICKAEFPDIAERAQASNPDNSGGALIFPEFSDRMVRLVESFGVFERLAFGMPMAGDTLTFIKRTGGTTVYLVGENTAGTDSEMAFNNVSLSAKEWGALTYVPKTLNEDAATDIGELVARENALAFASKMDDIGINGDGTSTYFGITGVRTALTNTNGVDDGGGLVLGAGNAWSELTLANHEKVAGQVPDYDTANNYWVCSRPYFFQVMVKLMLAGGGVTAGEIEGRRRMLFMGDPVEISQKMPKTEANSSVAALYGDLRLGATVGRRRDFSVESSTEYKFAERQVTYLATRRVAINVHDIGDATNAGPVVGLITASS